jgi:Kef-type K+ transport system membrane component KefB
VERLLTLVVAVATVGKVFGTYAGARLVGRRDHWTALAFGAGLNARDAMEIIIASVGLSLGVLTQAMFSIIVVMAIVTSLMAPYHSRGSPARSRSATVEGRQPDLGPPHSIGIPALFFYPGQKEVTYP